MLTACLPVSKWLLAREAPRTVTGGRHTPSPQDRMPTSCVSLAGASWALHPEVLLNGLTGHAEAGTWFQKWGMCPGGGTLLDKVSCHPTMEQRAGVAPVQLS